MLDPMNEEMPSSPVWITLNGARVLALAGLVFLLPGATQLADAAAVDELAGLVGTQWYAVHLMGQRTGYAYRNVQIVKDAEGNPRLVVEQKVQSRVKLAGLAQDLSIESLITAVYDTDLNPLSLGVRSDEFGRMRQVTAHVVDGAIEVHTRAGATENTTSFPLPEDFGSDLDLMLAILRGEAKVGYRTEFVTFEPDLSRCDRHVMWITEERTLEDGRQAFVVHSRGEALPLEVVSVIANDGDLISFSTPSLLQLEVVQTTEQEALKAAAPLVLSSEIQANLRVDNPRALSMLKVRLDRPGGIPLMELPSTVRQEATPNGEGLLLTVRRHKVKPSGATFPMHDEQFAPYFQPSDLFQPRDPVILETAREIVGQETDAQLAAEKIVQWVYRRLHKVNSEPRLISATEIMEQMSGDCTEHAILCASLCGAVGIPARMVTGIAHARGSFFYHAWNEIYVGQWVEMDPAWGENAVDAGHIRMASGPVDMSALANMALAAGRNLGALKVHVIEYALDDGPVIQTDESR